MTFLARFLLLMPTTLSNLVFLLCLLTDEREEKRDDDDDDEGTRKENATIVVVVKAYRMMLFSSSFDDDDDTRAYIIKRILLRSFSSQKSETFSLFVALLRSKIFLRGFVQLYLGFKQTLNRIALFPSSSSFGKTAACSTHAFII